MTKFRVDRKFLYKKDNDLIAFLTIIGTNVSTKSEFESIREKGTILLAKNVLFNADYLAVLEGDHRRIASRNKNRDDAEVIVREIAGDVNEMAAGDEVIIVAAGFLATSAPSPDRPLGETELISVEYLPGTGQVKLRCIKADRAADYQIDVSTDGVVWEEGVDSMPLTLFYIKWKKPKGHYFIRLCPRDKDGERGTPSNSQEITIY